jgi:shikimate kinase
VVLKKLIQSEQQRDFVMALQPSGLMDCMWAILKNVDGVVVALQDSAENILSRITFYDADSRRISKPLSDGEQVLHLREIKKDIGYFGRTFHRAELTVDIGGMGIEGSAAKIEELLRERQAGRQ